MNTFMNGLEEMSNFKRTENGALAHKTTRSEVYDMFALGGAYRSRSEEDCILLFKNALAENESLAMKCLFYLADCRGGQGERRFFRICFKWLSENHPEIAKRNLELIPEYRRWDDVLYSTVNTPVFTDALAFIQRQLLLDINSKTPSLLAKWLPSENASAKETRKMGNIVRSYLHLSHKEYRKTLSKLRNTINVLEKLMSEGRWTEIKFDKIPSRAGFIYRNAFARRDIIARRYQAFIQDSNRTVNTSTLYPYDIVSQAINASDFLKGADIDRLAINKYWENLPDYFKGNPCKMMCVVDTSGSMWGQPMNVAISLGMYCAERIGGPFKNHYISFASHPQLIKVQGVDFVDKVKRIYRTNLCDNTNLTAVFDLLKNIALRPETKAEDIPETIVVISDMEIDSATYSWRRDSNFTWTKNTAQTEMERIRKDWNAHGLKLPKLVYWNVNARNDTILDGGPDVSFISGCSPVIFEQVMTGKTGYDLMLDKLMSKRYERVK